MLIPQQWHVYPILNLNAKRMTEYNFGFFWDFLKKSLAARRSGLFVKGSLYPEKAMISGTNYGAVGCNTSRNKKGMIQDALSSIPILVMLLLMLPGR